MNRRGFLARLGVVVAAAAFPSVLLRQPDGVATAAASIRRAFPALFNVMDFGAKGDGVTDDGKAIRAALAAAEDAGGGVVYFPVGTYRTGDWDVAGGRMGIDWGYY